MMAFTDREKKIILVKYVIHGVSPFTEAPLGKRVKMLKAAVEKAGLNYDEEELMGIGEEIIDFQGNVNEVLKKFISDNREMVVQANKEIHKGNESLVNEIGEEVTKEGKELMKNPKWYDKFKP